MADESDFYEKQYADVPKPPVKAPKVKPLPPPVDLTEATITEFCQSLKPELLVTLREIAADPDAKPSDRLAATKELLERGFGKTSAEAPPLADKKNKDSVSSKVLELLTDEQLAQLREMQDG